MATPPEEAQNPNTIPMDRLIEGPDPLETYTVIAPNTQTSMRFIRAQGQFIRAMSYFMDEGRHVTEDKAYIEHLTGYAAAQGLFIGAQQDFLKALGAL